MATADATFRYKERFGEGKARTYFRRVGDRAVSSVGLGTYLGDPTDAVDDAYYETVRAAVESGCNVVDTAVNYRHQRSERVVGRALEDADVDRESVFLSTKGGFVAFEEDRPENPGQYVQREYVDAGLVDADDLAHGSHSIAPGFVDAQLDWSLANLGVDTIDLYYVHNPETQLDVRSAEAVYDQLEATFERLEERVAAGDIRHYGVATWDAFRVPRDHDHFLDLSELISRARSAAKAVGNTATHLRAIQLPFNVYMADAFTVDSQEGPEGAQSVLWYAHEAGLNVFTSASLAQGEVLDGVPEDVDEKLAGDTPAQRGLNFARSAPGVTCSLAGTTSPEHVRENVAAGDHEPLGADAFDAVFE
ncbi:aldo/keto reductase [Halobacterium litoreum]|uniref:Aldo/keto reductase n=1 Tax=Halobacterium litoreum TaxID=2039234 RepID=A0ABD5NGT6_9EURY|nr:aldo/keto reductase [Halobacterium litoreum]UHH12766.1 aldo/keto reductase [Halobacterium litoreum]